MDNRDRDKMSKNKNATPVGDVNREPSSRQEEIQSDSEAAFGHDIGRSNKYESGPDRRPGSSSEWVDLDRNARGEQEH